MANKITNIKERILYLSDYYEVKKEKFFEELGLNYGNFKGNAKNSPLNSDSLAIILTNYSDVNPMWLLTGEGEMLFSNYQQNSIVSEPSEVYKLRTDNLVPIQQIPLYSSEVSAGIVRLFRDKIPTKEFISIPNLPRSDGAMYVTGDSMYPLLKSGDIVIYKLIQDLKNFIFIWGEMYIIGFVNGGEDHSAVKYIQKSTKGDAYISLVSQNQNHQAIDLPLESVRALALVKASIRINSMN